MAALTLFACFVKEVLARGVLLPLINQLSDPDYINQFVIWMVRAATTWEPSYESMETN